MNQHLYPALVIVLKIELKYTESFTEPISVRHTSTGLLSTRIKHVRTIGFRTNGADVNDVEISLDHSDYGSPHVESLRFLVSRGLLKMIE